MISGDLLQQYNCGKLYNMRFERITARKYGSMKWDGE